MTPVQDVYDAFLATKVLDDEWGDWFEDEVNKDLFHLLQAAIPYFKFPRNSLELIKDEEQGICFKGDLNLQEINILANYMKCEWLNRIILTWENVKHLYEERDFSQANLLSKLTALLIDQRESSKTLEKDYYRSIEGKPFNYSKLYTKI